MNNKISVVCSDVVNVPCDVLILKFAQQFYGADRTVARLLNQNRNLEEIAPRPGQHTLLASRGKIAASHVLFVGTVDLYRFDYGEIRNFAYGAMQALAREMPNVVHVAMTIHGIGPGLDEREAFLSQLSGLSDAFLDGHVPASLLQITIVEQNQRRASRLQRILAEHFPSRELQVIKSGQSEIQQTIEVGQTINAGVQSNAKPHVFVAMPFSTEMEDVYEFGIRGPVNAAGYLCERVDMDKFMGDILARIKSRIETAAIVVADLTGSNANVYLEVGYAWGKGRPTLLITRAEDDLKFDVKAQNCIIYKNITHLAKEMEAHLAALKTE